MDLRSPMISKMLPPGDVVCSPPGNGQGYWAGAPGLFYDPAGKLFYLTYRLRRPRGVEPDRGGETCIACSSDGLQFRTLAVLKKGALRSASIERCALWKEPEGMWHYYVSFVDPQDGRWCVGCAKTASLEGWEPSDIAPLFTAKSLSLEGVKDPWLCRKDGLYYMFLSVAVATPQTREDSHSTLDIFNTGECQSATGLAVSRDLKDWDWQGVVFSPETGGWDSYCRRINSVVPYRNHFFGFYDGSSSHRENYEEKTGLAVSQDLRVWTSLTKKEPFWISPHGSGSLRYVNGFNQGETLHLYYESARSDGAHDLRHQGIRANDLLGPLLG